MICAVSIISARYKLLGREINGGLLSLLLTNIFAKEKSNWYPCPCEICHVHEIPGYLVRRKQTPLFLFHIDDPSVSYNASSPYAI